MNITCYLCDEPLTEQNRSFEHIIPNSIGGRLKSKDLMCKKCNESTGQLFDSIFSKLGNVYANQYQIKRERDEVRDVIAYDKETGEKFVLRPNGTYGNLNTIYKYREDVCTFSVYSRKRALQEQEKLKKILANQNRSLKNFSIERVLESNRRTFFVDVPINDALFFRAVAKIMCSFYIHKIKNKNHLDRIIKFIQLDDDNLYCWFLNLNVCKQLHGGKPYHVLIIKGCKKQKALYGFLEIFGDRGIVVLLNTRYSGEDLQVSYTYDPVSHQEIEYTYNFNLPISEVMDIVFHKPPPEITFI